MCRPKEEGISKEGEAPLLTRVLQITAHHPVDEHRLADHLGALGFLHRLGDEEEIREQETVNVHLEKTMGTRL